MRWIKPFILTCLFFRAIAVVAQVKDSAEKTFIPLDSVIVQGYSRPMRLKEAAAAVGLVRPEDWQRFSPVTALPAVNVIPGVRMEERSPGSYRLAIRGSSLRSPFGVRNIRMYYDQLPFTDPGGNTYLNGFPPAAFSQLEILKGPASSSYGAGTGGALLAYGDTSSKKSIVLNLTAGSYGLRQADAGLSFGTIAMNNRITLHHMRLDGYRNHTAMERTFGSWQATVRENDKASLSALVLYSDLHYETPGALTLAQYQQDPKQARPAAGPFPSAEDAQAAIAQKTFYSGIYQHFQPSSRLSLGISLYGAFTKVDNPTIRNYEERSEPHYGGRALFAYTAPVGRSKLQLTAGGEWQEGHYQVNVFRNKQGKPDSLQTADAVTPKNALIFSQVEFSLPGGWHPAGGISWNSNRVTISRETTVPVSTSSTDYRGEWCPRISLSKTFRSSTIYALASKGFSPPTTAELLPSTSVINTQLQAEWGWNYEAGFRGRTFKNRLWFDINVFYFRLQDAIVSRRDSSGADYFENAGSTRQYGFEGYLKYEILAQKYSQPDSWGLQYWCSYALNPFSYDQFKQGNTDYSGKQIPGIAKQVVSTGLDLEGPYKISAHLTYQYVDPIWLNDANTAKASAYQLLGFRVGSKIWRQLSGFAGADNLFNSTYSLGNDINAVGGRYYNAAMKRNYFMGLRIVIL
ncbi:TonB-dependent receptor [Flavihumibacter profundi]|uniref:TonB-dependent receptor n=1 Tax=Flavihumibacter profundi TaxID=2716883 RepID=UPI001CC3E8BA|nr:TonB-dependent receptor plug domain-containing protein [Flavihumibacter profundi]MBZ5858044.1 TonB-dependent receptor plug domain-containing protein [Flavihumibacter profundi]